ncbi:NACHT, LRR and PYD domains-containing protein 12-like [Alligator sinensis]|uniref:NACHT, LRR and PYD domains-containing protein 12-like n=1 Tax=Alligator sinensis TaxID=38654 RepID=A0A3Q0FSE9_ALLSI|nr:NACHT, LRR and PYD domains-containing protein 12-like [Alligator sinensis]
MYTEHIQNNYRYIKDRNSLLGEKVNLTNRYTKLVIVKDPHAKKKDLHEIMTLREKYIKTTSEQRRALTISDLFACDENGETPRIVVLLGAAGTGKTMTARKIMFDWASGELYQNKFDYVFYIHCRGFKLGSEQRSLEDLILTNCPDERAPVEEILRCPEKILFIIDGFDELRFSLDQPEDNLCSDPHEKKAVEITLSSLFRKKVLQKSYLLITTRPAALEKLNELLENERCVKILGFSETEMKEYFDKYFGDKERARKAFNFVRENEMIFTMCSVPMVCWIICTVIEQQMDEGEDLAQSSETITGVYLLYLHNLLKGCDQNSKQPIRANLKRLCSLAAEGICKQKILFEAEELKKHSLDTSDSRFLNENLFRKASDQECLYSFIHLSFQEFFAALFYALENEEERTGRDSGNDIKGLKTLLADYGKSRNYLMLTVRFLFGLLNEGRMKAIEKKLSCKISLNIKPKLLTWIKTKPRTCPSPSFAESGRPQTFPSQKQVETIPQLEDFHCLYEIREKSFVQNALSHFVDLRLDDYTFTRLDQVALAFCLKNCQKLESLTLNSCAFVSEDPEEGTDEDSLRPLKQLHLTSLNLAELDLTGNNGLGAGGMQLLCEGLRHPSCKLQTLRLWGCDLTDACCGDLATALSTSPNLTELDLSFVTGLGAGSMQLLLCGLRHPCCKLQTLRLRCCSLTDACCRLLAAALSTSPSLMQLDLSGNKDLGDGGVQLLCEGLTNPSCKLQTLRLHSCCLTDGCCGDLTAALKTNPSLTELNLGGNTGLGDGGVRLLCEWLRHPSCKFQILGLWGCDLTDASCGDLASALSTSLTLLDLGYNTGLGAGGVRLLCEGLRHPSCKLQTLGLSLHKLDAEIKQELEAVKGIKPGLVIEELKWLVFNW